MLIQAIGTFTFETEGQKQPLVIPDGEFADIPNGAALDAVQQGTARAATMAEACAPKKREVAPEAPVRVSRGNRRFHIAGQEEE